MTYNKHQFTKVNDKKVLHKVRKQWVTISVALLGMLGLGVYTTTFASANSNSQTNGLAQQINSNLNNARKQAAYQASHPKAVSLNPKGIEKQATQMTDHLMRIAGTNGHNPQVIENNHQKPIVLGGLEQTQQGEDTVQYIPIKGNYTGQVVGQFIFKGPKGTPDTYGNGTFGIDDLDSHHPYGLDLSKYDVAPNGASTLNAIRQHNYTYSDGTPVKVDVVPAIEDRDTVNYTYNGGIISSVPFPGSQSNNDIALNTYLKTLTPTMVPDNKYYISNDELIKAKNLGETVSYNHSGAVITIPLTLRYTSTDEFQFKLPDGHVVYSIQSTSPHGMTSDEHDLGDTKLQNVAQKLIKSQDINSDLGINLSDPSHLINGQPDTYYYTSDALNSDIWSWHLSLYFNANSKNETNVYTIPVKEYNYIIFKDASGKVIYWDKCEAHNYQGSTYYMPSDGYTKDLNNAITFTKKINDTTTYAVDNKGKAAINNALNHIDPNGGNITTVEVSPQTKGEDTLQYVDKGKTVGGPYTFNGIKGQSDNALKSLLQYDIEYGAYVYTPSDQGLPYTYDNYQQIMKALDNRHSYSGGNIKIDVDSLPIDRIEFYSDGKPNNIIGSDNMAWSTFGGSDSDWFMRNQLNSIKQNENNMIELNDPKNEQLSDADYILEPNKSRQAANTALNSQDAKNKEYHNWVVKIPVINKNKAQRTVTFNDYYKNSLIKKSVFNQKQYPYLTLGPFGSELSKYVTESPYEWDYVSLGPGLGNTISFYETYINPDYTKYTISPTSVNRISNQIYSNLSSSSYPELGNADYNVDLYDIYGQDVIKYVTDKSDQNVVGQYIGKLGKRFYRHDVNGVQLNSHNQYIWDNISDLPISNGNETAFNQKYKLTKLGQKDLNNLRIDNFTDDNIKLQPNDSYLDYNDGVIYVHVASVLPDKNKKHKSDSSHSSSSSRSSNKSSKSKSNTPSGGNTTTSVAKRGTSTNSSGSNGGSTMSQINNATFTVNYELPLSDNVPNSDRTVLSVTSTGIQGNPVNGTTLYNSSDVKETLTGPQGQTYTTYLPTNLQLPDGTVAHPLLFGFTKIDPSYIVNKLNNKHYTFNNETLHIPLISSVATAKFRYVDKNTNQPIYPFDFEMSGANQGIVPLNDASKIPFELPDYTDPSSIHGLLSNYKFAPGFEPNGLTGVEFDNRVHNIYVVPNGQHNTYRKAAIYYHYEHPEKGQTDPTLPASNNVDGSMISALIDNDDQPNDKTDLNAYLQSAGNRPDNYRIDMDDPIYKVTNSDNHLKVYANIIRDDCTFDYLDTKSGNKVASDSPTNYITGSSAKDYIDAKLPQGYELVHLDSDQKNYPSGGTVNLYVTKIPTTENVTVNYVETGTTKVISDFIDDNAKINSDISQSTVNVNKPNGWNIVSGYDKAIKVINGVTKYDVLIEQPAPKVITDSDTIIIKDLSDTTNIILNSNTKCKAKPGSKGMVTIPRGYHITDVKGANTNIDGTYTFNGGDHEFDIAKNSGSAAPKQTGNKSKSSGNNRPNKSSNHTKPKKPVTPVKHHTPNKSGSSKGTPVKPNVVPAKNLHKSTNKSDKSTHKASTSPKKTTRPVTPKPVTKHSSNGEVPVKPSEQTTSGSFVTHKTSSKTSVASSSISSLTSRVSSMANHVINSANNRSSATYFVPQSTSRRITTSSNLPVSESKSNTPSSTAKLSQSSMNSNKSLPAHKSQASNIVRKDSLGSKKVHRLNHKSSSLKLPQTSEPQVHASVWAAVLAGLSAIVAALGHAVERRKRHDK